MEQTIQAEMTTFDVVPDLETVLTHFFDDMPEGILFLDQNWHITYANQAARGISRIRPEDINSKTHWELYPETIGTEVETVYRDVMANRVERHLETPYEPFQLWLDIRVLPVPGGIGLHYRDITKLHNAEEARRAAADRLEQVLTATHDGVITLDRGFRITYMNRRARTMLAPRGDIMGRDLFETFPAAIYENSPYVENYRRTAHERVVTSFEAFYPEPLNLWFNVTAHPSEEGIVIFFRDITEEKAKSDALRASEERYRILAELSPQSQWTASPGGLVLYANQRFIDYIGHERAPRTGEEYIQCFAEEDRARVRQVWSRSIATGEDYNIEARLIRASDGAARWWHLRALPVRDASGAILQWLGTATDIHESRTAAEKLRAQFEEIDRSRRELETIYNSSPIGMALYEPTELRLLRMNDRQAEIFRLPAAEAVGRRYEELSAGVPAALPLIRRAAAGEKVVNHELEGAIHRRPDEYRYWNANYSPIFAPDGSVQAIASATIEITQQKRAEAALIQSEKLAAVGRMASSIAHEINNPLESVTNLIYISRQYSVVPEVREFLELADQELRRVSIIANQTLRFHKQSTQPREITCQELFSTVLSLYEGRLRNCAILVEKRKRTNRPLVCFEGDIRQVLNNLVGNAIDAMPHHGRLLLRSRDATDWRTGRKGIVLTIADDGSGMSPQTLDRIFEPFFTTKGFNGTGLGLWICAQIVDRHHGRLMLRSSQHLAHRGTVFSLFLPFEAPISETSQLLN